MLRSGHAEQRLGRDESFLPESQTLQVDAGNAHEKVYEVNFSSLSRKTAHDASGSRQ